MVRLPSRLIGLMAALPLTTVASALAGNLGVELGNPVRYRCAGGSALVVRYGRLSDDSLSFARLQPPGEQLLTLPQLVSGSGARYSNEQMWQWWSKGQGGFLQRRDGQGEWRTVLEGCRSDDQQS